MEVRSEVLYFYLCLTDGRPEEGGDGDTAWDAEEFHCGGTESICDRFTVNLWSICGRLWEFEAIWELRSIADGIGFV